MNNKKIQDLKKRRGTVQFEKKKNVFKSLIKNQNMSKLTNWELNLKFLSFNMLYTKNKFVNRCIITGRKNNLNKVFRLSRLQFLEFARSGYIAGVKKSTW